MQAGHPTFLPHKGYMAAYSKALAKYGRALYRLRRTAEPTSAGSPERIDPMEERERYQLWEKALVGVLAEMGRAGRLDAHGEADHRGAW